MPEASSPEDTKEIDLVHFGDIVDVDFAGGFEFDWRGRITPDGNLDGFGDLPEPVYALCRSENEIAADIERAFSRILREPKVSVKIIDRSNRAVVRLDGAVKMPVRFLLRRSVHLRELLVAAGGITDEAGGDIQILRPANLNCTKQSATAAGNAESNSQTPRGNGFQRLNITIKDLLANKELADPLILSGDIITVTKAEPVYVIGAVNNPRPVYLHNGMTLMRAIDSAGGVSKGALLQGVAIFRREGTERQTLTVDLQKIKSGELNDVDLKAFDIIEVAFKGRAQRKYPPVLNAAGSGQQNTVEPPLKVID